MRQSDVDDRGVEDFHERGQRDRNRNEPGIVPGLPGGAGGGRCGLRCAHLTVTAGSAEIPSGSGILGSRPLSMTILTGTRCTTLTKLPVAFSGGKAVNLDPEPSWMLSTWPRRSSDGKASTPILTFCPAR